MSLNRFDVTYDLRVQTFKGTEIVFVGISLYPAKLTSPNESATTSEQAT